MSADQHRLEELIAATDGFGHLRVKKYGDHLILISGEADDEQKHARLTRFRADEWGLSLWHHTGRWEKLPFTGSLPNLFATLAESFSMFLEHY